MSDPYLVDPSLWTMLLDRLKHMVLPSSVVTLVIFGSFALVVRSSYSRR